MDRTLGRQCTICNHPQRLEIDTALASRATYRAIARQYGVSKDALSRHKRNGHIAEHIAKAAQKKEIKEATALKGVLVGAEEKTVAEAETLLQQVTTLKTRAIAILDNAEKEGTREACLALSEVRRTLEFLAKITGELQDGKPAVNVTVNLLQSPEFKQVLVVLDEELPDKYRERIARRLYALDT
jgi:hypothetical protein